jgi:hypothetical protein
MVASLYSSAEQNSAFSMLIQPRTQGRIDVQDKILWQILCIAVVILLSNRDGCRESESDVKDTVRVRSAKKRVRFFVARYRHLAPWPRPGDGDNVY